MANSSKKSYYCRKFEDTYLRELSSIFNLPSSPGGFSRKTTSDILLQGPLDLLDIGLGAWLPCFCRLTQVSFDWRFLDSQKPGGHAQLSGEERVTFGCHHNLMGADLVHNNPTLPIRVPQSEYRRGDIVSTAVDTPSLPDVFDSMKLLRTKDYRLPYIDMFSGEYIFSLEALRVSRADIIQRTPQSPVGCDPGETTPREAVVMGPPAPALLVLRAHSIASLLAWVQAFQSLRCSGAMRSHVLTALLRSSLDLRRPPPLVASFFTFPQSSTQERSTISLGSSTVGIRNADKPLRVTTDFEQQLPPRLLPSAVDDVERVTMWNQRWPDARMRTWLHPFFTVDMDTVPAEVQMVEPALREAISAPIFACTRLASAARYLSDHMTQQHEELREYTPAFKALSEIDDGLHQILQVLLQPPHFDLKVRYLGVSRGDQPSDPQSLVESRANQAGRSLSVLKNVFSDPLDFMRRLRNSCTTLPELPGPTADSELIT